MTGSQPFGLLSRELVQHFSTTANMRFTIFSQAIGDYRDVFSDVLAPYYNSDVWTSTFMRSKLSVCLLNSCSVLRASVFRIVVPLHLTIMAMLLSVSCR